MKVVMQSIFVLFTLFWMTGVLASAEKESMGSEKKTRTSQLDPTVFKDKIFVNKNKTIHQALERMNHIMYGKTSLDKRGKELEDLLSNPPLGSHTDYCYAQRNNNRALFTFAGLLAPELSFHYLSSLGRILKVSNPSETEPIYFHHFFDYVMLLTGCSGAGGDRLVHAVYDLYNWKLFNNGDSERESQVQVEVESMKTNLHVLMRNNTALFKPNCKESSFNQYFKDKMKDLRRQVNRMNLEETSDLDMKEVIDEHLFVTSYASTWYICTGFLGLREEEVANEKSIMYQMRGAYNHLMAREMEREKNLMDTLKPESEVLNGDYYRHKSFILPVNTTLHCGDLSGEITERKVLNLYYCGTMCKELFEEAKRTMDTDDENKCYINTTQVPCSACYLVYPSLIDPVKGICKNVGIVRNMGEHKVIVFPGRKSPLPVLLMPELTVEHVTNVTSVDMIWRRPTPPKTEFPVYPKRVNYIPHKTRGDIDWEWLKWTSVKLYCGITVGIWTIYFTVGNYFYIRRWIRRRLGWA